MGKRTGIPSPLGDIFGFQPPQKVKQVNVRVELRKNKIPKSLILFTRILLTAVAFAAPLVWIHFDEGWARWASLLAMVAWTIASVDAVVEHIIKQEPDSRQEITEEIERAKNIHTIIK